MARIFSIQFKYKDSLQNAMVSVRQTPFYTEYKITALDDDLAQLLPSDKVISTAPGHFIFPNVLLQNYNDLMKEVINAISVHIHSLQY